jgi:hypothetical protein
MITPTRRPRRVKRRRPITQEELRRRETRMDALRARHEQHISDPKQADEVRRALTRLQESFEAAHAAAEPPRMVTTWPQETPVVPDPMIGLLQLHAADAPNIAFPDGTDLMQLLWCPHDHDEVPGAHIMEDRRRC